MSATGRDESDRARLADATEMGRLSERSLKDAAALAAETSAAAADAMALASDLLIDSSESACLRASQNTAVPNITATTNRAAKATINTKDGGVGGLSEGTCDGGGGGVGAGGVPRVL